MTAVQMGSEAFANWKWLQSTSGLGTTGVNQTVAALKVKYELELHYVAQKDQIQYKIEKETSDPFMILNFWKPQRKK